MQHVLKELRLKEFHLDMEKSDFFLLLFYHSLYLGYLTLILFTKWRCFPVILAGTRSHSFSETWMEQMDTIGIATDPTYRHTI